MRVCCSHVVVPPYWAANSRVYIFIVFHPSNLLVARNILKSKHANRLKDKENAKGNGADKEVGIAYTIQCRHINEIIKYLLMKTKAVSRLDS